MSTPAATPSGPPEGKVNFRAATYDRRVIVIILLFLATATWFGLTTISGIVANAPADLFSASLFVIITGLILYRWLSSVRGYTLDWGSTGPADAELLIRRWLPLFNTTLALNRLRFAYYEPELPPLLNTSILSQGALFGWAGTASLAELGMVQAYATSNRKAVVLEFQRPESAWQRSSSVNSPRARGPLYIVSPADPAAFAAELRRLPGIGGREEALAAAEAAKNQPPPSNVSQPATTPQRNTKKR